MKGITTQPTSLDEDVRALEMLLVGFQLALDSFCPPVLLLGPFAIARFNEFLRVHPDELSSRAGPSKDLHLPRQAGRGSGA